MGKAFLFISLLFYSFNLFSITDSLVLKPNATNGKDATVWSFYANSNYAANDEAMVAAWIINGGYPSNHKWYVEFNISSIPQGTVIDSSFLFLYYNPLILSHAGVHSGNNSFYVKRVTSSWIEDSITWNNQPTKTNTNKVTVPKTISGTQDFKINVTALTQDLLDSTNYGFCLQMVNQTPSKAIISASSDHANSAIRPMLKVYYKLCSTPEAGFIANAINKTVSFTDTTNSTTIYNRLWDFGDGTFSTQQNPTKTYTNSGVYNTCLIVTDSCGQDTVCQIINLCAAPTPIINYSINGATIQFQGKPNNANSYLWDFGDGSFITIQNPSYTYSYGGNYKVCLTVSDSCGTDTSCTQVVIPNIGLEEVNIHSYGVYPNPSQNEFRIKGPIDKIQKISIYNCTGQLIKSFKPEIDSLDMKLFENGVYFVQIKTKEEDVILKVIKL